MVRGVRTMKRLAAAVLSLSAAGLLAIAGYEGYSEVAYMPTAQDVWTIGFGSTQGVRPGDRVSVQQALSRLRKDVAQAEGSLVKCVKVPLSQDEFDAYTSFAFNVGEEQFCGSTLVKKLNAGDYSGACSELRRWVYQGGVKLPGLEQRRADEFLTCMGLKER